MESGRYSWMLFMLIVATFGYQSGAKGEFCPSHRRSHPTNCSLFFYCVNITMHNTKHVWVPGKCNFGLVFEPILGMCVIPGSSSSCQRDYTSSTIDLMREFGNQRMNYPLQTPAEEPYLEYEMPIKLGDGTIHPLLKPISSQTNALRMANAKRPNDKLSMNDYSSTSMNLEKQQNEQWDNWNGKSNIQRTQGNLPFGYPTPDLSHSPAFRKGGTNNQNSYNAYSMLNPSYLDPKLSARHPSSANPLLKTNEGPDLKNRPATFGDFNHNFQGYQNYIKDSPIRQDGKINSYINDNSKIDASAEMTNKLKGNGMKKYSQQDEEDDNVKINASTNSDDVTEGANETQIETDSSSESTTITIEIQQPEHQTKQRRKECRNGGRVPNLNDCTKYFMCDPVGDLITHSCPRHTSFNSYTKRCETKAYQDCLQQTHKSIAQPSFYDAYNDYGEASSDSLVPQFHSVTSVPSPIEESFTCSKEGKFPDPVSSDSYYICNTDEEKKTLLKHKIPCPGSLQFCARKKVCTFAEKCSD